MRLRPGIAALALGALLVAPVPALAQATVDPKALDTLSPPATATPPQTPAHKPATKHPPAKTATKDAPAQAAPAPAAPPHQDVTVRPIPGGPATSSMPTVPKAPPPPIVLPPPLAVPTRPVQPPPPAPVVANAPGDVILLANGLRLTFGAGRAELNPAAEAALKELVHGSPGQPPPSPATTYTVTTYAAGTEEDPSTPRRLSLSRALAVRSVLMNQGVPSIQIYVRALGPNADGFADGPADRADLTVAVPKPAVGSS